MAGLTWSAGREDGSMDVCEQGSIVVDEGDESHGGRGIQDGKQREGRVIGLMNCGRGR